MARAPGFDWEMAGSGVGSLFGAAATVLGANASVDAARKQAEYLNRSAEYDLLKGRLTQAEIFKKAAATISEQKVSYAAQGVDLASESVSQVREEAFYESTRIANEVELAAAMDAWGKREQGKIGIEAAEDAQRAARIGAVGQVIGGAAMLGGAFA